MSLDELHIEPQPVNSSTRPPSADTRGQWWTLAHVKHLLLSLPGKTLLIVLATLAGLTLVLFLPLRYIFLNSFVELERQKTVEQVQRVLRSVSNNLDTLRNSIPDYSSWDDTYEFMADRNQEYIDKNTDIFVFLNNRINLMIFVDNAGQVVFAKTLDLASGEELPLPEALHSFPADHPLVSLSDYHLGRAGLLMVDDKPLLVAALPILDSSFQGPRRGTLIWGRFLDTAAMKNIGHDLDVDIDAYRLDRDPLPADVMTALTSNSGVGDLANPLSERVVAGYSLFTDLFGKPLLAIRVKSDRYLFLQGQDATRSFIYALLMASLVFAIVAILLLYRFVLSRLSRLTREVSAIGAGADLTARVQFTSDDELTRLAHTINTMLSALEHAQTERLRAEEERRQAEEEVQRSRREFIGTVSHELRTPLTPIIGYVDLLLTGAGGAITSDQRDFLKTIKNNSLRMNSLVDDLLEVSRIGSGRVELHLAPTHVDGLINETIHLFQEHIATKDQHLAVHIADDLPIIAADGRRITQVLNNLVSNASKYTPNGGSITVRATINHEEIAIQVGDTGVGLSPEQTKKLFTPFYRADNGLRDQVSGTGLGLSIARSFVQMHGGDIEVESEVGRGSTFTVYLPIKANEAGAG